MSIGGIDMDGDLAGKVAIITGAARGMGRSHALALARHGVNIVAADLCATNTDNELGEDFRATVKAVKDLGVEIIALKCDVRYKEDVQAMVQACIDRFHKVDILVANAGIMRFGLTWELTEEDVWQMLDVNLMGVWRCNKEVIPHMIANKGGKIVNISSTAGLKATPRLCHYTMSKFGVIGLTKTLAKEVAPYGINVNVVCPTVVATSMTMNEDFLGYVSKSAGYAIKTVEEAEKFLSAHHPLKKGFLSPDDVSNAVVWLCSEKSKFITGSVITIDAGSML